MKLARNILLSLLIAHLIISFIYIKAFEVSLFSEAALIIVISFIVTFTLFIILQLRKSIKDKKTVQILFSSLLTCFIYLVALIYFVSMLSLMSYIKKNTNTWFVSDSEDGKYSVKVVMTGSTWPFRPQDIVIYCNGEKVYETSIANDGKILSDENYSIKWDDNIAVLSFYGEEQEKEVITITFADGSAYAKSSKDKVRELNTFSAEVSKPLLITNSSRHFLISL